MSENVQAAPESAVPVQKTLTKLQLKKMKQYQERRQRAINKGVPEAQVDAVLAREDYERMPVGDKLKRLEGFIASTLAQLAEEINNLRHNDNVLADAMDVNFRSITKALVKLGLSEEVQKQIVDEVQAEIVAAQAKAKEEAEKAAATDKANVDVAGEPAPVPEAATTFGG